MSYGRMLKNGSQDMWLWVAADVKTKLIPVLQVGGKKPGDGLFGGA